jgi:prevent-host-death family protein
MKTYTYSEARNRLAEVLEESKRGEVIIRRRRGETFSVVPKSQARRSPFDVPGVGRGTTRRELLAAIRETRSRRGTSRRAQTS